MALFGVVLGWADPADDSDTRRRRFSGGLLTRRSLSVRGALKAVASAWPPAFQAGSRSGSGLGRLRYGAPTRLRFGSRRDRGTNRLQFTSQP